MELWRRSGKNSRHSPCSLQFVYLSHHYTLLLYCCSCVITSSLWTSRRQRSLRAARPMSSTLNPHKRASSSLRSPAEAAAVRPAGSVLAAEESKPLLLAEEERSESRDWHSWDRWRSNRERRRTPPGHDLFAYTIFILFFFWFFYPNRLTYNQWVIFHEDIFLVLT